MRVSFARHSCPRTGDVATRDTAASPISLPETNSPIVALGKVKYATRIASAHPASADQVALGHRFLFFFCFFLFFGILVCFFTFVLCACGGSTSNSNVAIDTRDIIVQIDPTVETPAYMSIGEQLDDHAAYDQINGQIWLNALSARRFRLHAGADNADLTEPDCIAGVAA